MVFRVEATEGSKVRLEKPVAYHTSRGVPVRELSDRCDRTLDRAARHGARRTTSPSSAPGTPFLGQRPTSSRGRRRGPATQQAIRYNIFSLAQAIARTDGIGVPAKGVTGSGYEGHYFWDSEIYVVPFLTFTQPHVARNLLHFRNRMLPAARDRAREMAQSGALFPGAPINGEEASAYYAAGSAQMHINADIAYALMQYVRATNDDRVPGPRRRRPAGRDRTDVGRARVLAQQRRAVLPHPRRHRARRVHDRREQQPVHQRDGPLQPRAGRAGRRADPRAVPRRASSGSPPGSACWTRRSTSGGAAPTGMTIPFDEGLGIHPQDDFFLDREVWDLSRTPDEMRPADAALPPAGASTASRCSSRPTSCSRCSSTATGSPRSRRAPTSSTTTRSPPATRPSRPSCSRSSPPRSATTRRPCDYFRQALYVDLADLHENTVDGLHVASPAGSGARLVFGFAGMRDRNGRLSFDPRLPAGWPWLRFRLRWRGSRLLVELTQHPDGLHAARGR